MRIATWARGIAVAILSFGARLAECLLAAEELDAAGLSATVADPALARPRQKFEAVAIFVRDLLAPAFALWLVREARAMGAPWHVTARMLGNVAVDGVVGLVPLAGDAFDVLFRANMRNVRLLRRWLDKQPR